MPLLNKNVKYFSQSAQRQSAKDAEKNVHAAFAGLFSAGFA
jgi:hypothetical protein